MVITLSLLSEIRTCVMIDRDQKTCVHLFVGAQLSSARRLPEEDREGWAPGDYSGGF